jgi:beta-galactosidase/beta-glucuronidase
MPTKFTLLLLASLSFCVLHAATADPSTPIRMEICLNGAWDTVLNAGGDQIPSAGWSPRRVPAMPITGNPPATSIWHRYNVRIPILWIKPERNFLLKIDKAGHYAAVYWNGQRMGEHYGQFSPFEIDVTAALKPGDNEIAIYVHNASGKYARPGVVVSDPMEGNAYRGATDNPAQRNWVGIVGDISLAWRPAAHISDVFVVPSVRKKQLTARIETAGAGAYGATVRAAVLDKSSVLLEMPEKGLTGGAAPELAVPWPDAVLWGPEPYGKAKLYVLRTELLRGGKVVDRTFTRFGFREVWVEGKDVLLNGKKLWMAGTYFGKLAPIRYINDRRPEARMLQLMQEAGLDTLHGHWDELGDPGSICAIRWAWWC